MANLPDVSGLIGATVTEAQAKVYLSQMVAFSNLLSTQVLAAGTGILAYTTYANLPASPAQNSTAFVTNDPTPAKNGIYYYNGSAWALFTDQWLTFLTLNNYIGAPTGASLIGFQQAGTGSVARTIASKLSDVLYATDYTSIQSAINAAGTSNSVIIPATYTGTDSYVNNNNIQVLDYRNNQLGVWSVISSAWNVDKYPYGNDLVLRASGSADTYIEKLVVAATTTAPLVVGVNTNVLISSVTLGSAARGAVKTGTSTMFSAFGGLLVGRDTPNEEYISYSNVTIIDATHITFTCAKTHTGTTDLEQVGSTLLTSPDLYIIPSAVKASQTTGFNPQLRVKDLHGTPFLYLPSDIQSPFPYALAQWRAVQGGANGTNLDLIFQHAGTASSFIYRDPNLNVLLQLNPTGQLSVNSGFSSGAGAMNLTGSVAEVQIGRNQAGAAITSTVDCHVVWQGGTDPLNPSATAGSLLLAARNIANCSINFATQNTVRASIAPTGLNVVNGFGCNAKPAQGSVAVNAASTDLASAIALVNQLRAALIANGICI